jgi:two-component system OmpR family response regulator
MNLLIVEDNKELAIELKEFLSSSGYICKISNTCSDALDEANSNEYDIILLDLGLPDGSGFDVLKSIRKNQSKIAIIVITAKGDLEDKILGLQLGADDYLTKPFALTELQARLFAIVRRLGGFAQNELMLYDFKLHLQDYKLSHEEIPIKLTKKEFDIFQYLILNKNRVITRTQLIEHVWGDILELSSDSNFIDVHVRNLRKKLAKHSSIEWFETVRNVGYRINI